MRAPILFLIFNRPAQTERVFAEIARAQPSKLLIVADGPRSDRRGEVERCEAVRRIVERVNWDCEILRNYSDVNLGCGRRVASGLEWTFSLVEEAIVLEDDTLPSPSFFPFCEQLLDKYRDDTRVMHISGNNYLSTASRREHSYYFSRYDHIWGWATWRRAYRHYDFEMALWPALREKRWLQAYLGNGIEAQWWQDSFNRASTGTRSIYDSWDTQWLYSIWTQNGLSITPSVNLVTNIGWDANATHTSATDNPLSVLPLGEIQFPLRHPPQMVPDYDSDLAAFEATCMRRPSRGRVQNWLRHRLPSPVRLSLQGIVPGRSRRSEQG